MPKKKDDPWTTLKIRESTKSELVKMQGLYQMHEGKTISYDKLIRDLIDAQPKVDMEGKVTPSPRSFQ